MNVHRSCLDTKQFVKYFTLLSSHSRSSSVKAKWHRARFESKMVDFPQPVSTLEFKPPPHSLSIAAITSIPNVPERCVSIMFLSYFSIAAVTPSLVMLSVPSHHCRVSQNHPLQPTSEP